MTESFIKPIQSSLGLPMERLAQLRALAEYHGTTAVEIIERTIRNAIEAGEIDDSLPGFAEVTVVDDDLMIIEIRGQSLPPLDRDQAGLIAALVDAAAGKASAIKPSMKVGKASGLDLGADVKLVVGRHAKAILLALVDTRSGETTFQTATSVGIAVDFARLIRKRAAGLGFPVSRLMAAQEVRS